MIAHRTAIPFVAQRVSDQLVSGLGVDAHFLQVCPTKQPLQCDKMPMLVQKLVPAAGCVGGTALSVSYVGLAQLRE